MNDLKVNDKIDNATNRPCSDLPLVNIVTPVYNGAKYLAECIESVINQTYSNWEFIILNNCSTDGTLQIAEHYAQKDDRITVISNKDFLKQLPNWNKSIEKVSPNSKYCKLLQADDWLYPEFLEKMVARAEEYSSAGIISAYRFVGSEMSRISGEGLDSSTVFLTGRDTGRRVMQSSLFLFGSATSVLYKTDLVKDRNPFYDATVIHADTDACFDLLQKTNFAFVHQILSFTRRHDEAGTTFCDYYNTYILNDLYTIVKYGNYYLSTEEYNELLSATLSIHHHTLAEMMFNGCRKQVWEYHKEELDRMGLSIKWPQMLKIFLSKIVKIKPVLRLLLQKSKSWSSVEPNEASKKATIEDKKAGIALSKT